MNIEELSKAQLILLMIFVNFIVSVATSIIVVSLLDQAPAFVTQTVNQVVEHTIQTVEKASPTTIVQKTTPAPSNQDLVTAAIGEDAARVVAIYSAKTGTSTPAVATGTFLGGTARAVATISQKDLPQEALIEFTDGSYLPASLTREKGGVTIYGFADAATLPQINAPKLVAANDLKLGETALALATDGSASTGIVSKVSSKGVQTTLPPLGVGAAVVDLAGNIIGISSGASNGLLLSADTITEALTATSTPVSAAATSTPTVAATK